MLEFPQSTPLLELNNTTTTTTTITTTTKRWYRWGGWSTCCKAQDASANFYVSPPPPPQQQQQYASCPWNIIRVMFFCFQLHYFLNYHKHMGDKNWKWSVLPNIKILGSLTFPEKVYMRVFKMSKNFERDLLQNTHTHTQNKQSTWGNEHMNTHTSQTIKNLSNELIFEGTSDTTTKLLRR